MVSEFRSHAAMLMQHASHLLVLNEKVLARLEWRTCFFMDLAIKHKAGRKTSRNPVDYSAVYTENDLSLLPYITPLQEKKKVDQEFAMFHYLHTCTLRLMVKDWSILSKSLLREGSINLSVVYFTLRIALPPIIGALLYLNSYILKFF